MTDKAVTVVATPPLATTAEVFAEVESDFERGDGGDTFPLEGITVSTDVTRAGNIRLSICLDADRPEYVHTGRYLGSVRLVGSDVESTALPIEVTLKDQRWKVLAWMLAGLIFGLALKAATDFNNAKTTLSSKTLLDYVTQPAFSLAVLTGILGATFAYTQLYDANPAWGTNADHVKVLLAGVALQVTGMTASDLISPYDPGRGRGGKATEADTEPNRKQSNSPAPTRRPS
jgi:hypothetical protein